MSVFTYRARTAEGELVSGTMTSETSDVVARELKKTGHYPIEIRENRDTGAADAADKAGPKIKREVLADFFRQLNDLIRAGIPLARALELLGDNLKDRRMAEISQRLCGAVKSGSSLNDAMKSYPRAFSPLVRGIVGAGEGGGGLENVLDETVRFLEEETDLADRVRGLLAYPLIMALMGAGTLIFFLTFVIPRFAGIFEEMGQALPLMTRVLLNTGFALSHYGWLVIVATVAVFLLSRAYTASPDGRRALDRLLLSIPLSGRISMQLNVGRFSRALGLMLRNGVPLLRALDLASAAVGNTHIGAELSRLSDSTREGGTLNSAFRNSGVVDAMVVDLVR
ncbi:type II secretion system F family protein, partial [bacterium]